MSTMADEAEVEGAEVEEAESAEVEEPEVEETDGAEEGVETEAPDYSWVADLGEPDAVKEAVRFNQYVRTQEGAADYLVEAGMALGLTLEQIEGLFAKDEEPEPDDGDEVMTRAEYRAEQARQAQEQAAQQAQQQGQVVSGWIDTAAESLEIDPKQLPFVLQLADEHLPQGPRTEKEVAAAIAKGYEEALEVFGVEKQARVDRKAEQARKSPKPLRGKSPGGEKVPEPKDVKDAIARVRQSMRDNGELD